MKHAILGAGGVGLAIGAALARGQHDVVLIMREDSRAAYPGSIRVHSRLRDSYSVPVPALDRLDDDVDVVWVTVKAPALIPALGRIGGGVTSASIVPLLNGIDHMRVLRSRFGDRALAGSIRIEAERSAPGEVAWHSLFAIVELATDGKPALSQPVEALRSAVRGAGLGCHIRRHASAVLWEKLALVAPLALATTVAGGPVGAVRRDAELHGLMLDVAREICAVASTERVTIDVDALLRALRALPGRTDTSLRRDAAAGQRPTELTALMAPVARLGAASGVPTPATVALAERAHAAGA